jgi:hypothetical protein
MLNETHRALPRYKSSDFFSSLLVCKRLDWINEEEVRLILPRSKGTTVRLNDPRWLTKIILGMNMSAENERQIREWAKQRQPELTVVRAYLDKVRQELRLKE